jgi:hypothetical protein
MKWSDHREELVLGRCLDPLVVLINIYKNRYAIVRILVSMFGGLVRDIVGGFAAGGGASLQSWPKTWSKIWLHVASKRPRHSSEVCLC